MDAKFGTHSARSCDLRADRARAVIAAAGDEGSGQL